jgi:hypothetical protein
VTCNFGSRLQVAEFEFHIENFTVSVAMPPVLPKLTSFFPPVITDREKANNNARNLARINMRRARTMGRTNAV